jgi:hypothetical protein
MACKTTALCLSALLAFGVAQASASAQLDSLREMAGDNLDELFAAPAFSRIVHDLLGRRFGEALQLTAQAPPVEIHDNRYLFAEGCFPGACTSMGALFVVDAETGDALILLAPDGRTRAEPFDIFVTNRQFDLPSHLDAAVAKWKQGKADFLQ